MTSINAGAVTSLRYRGKTVASGFDKQPLAGPVMLTEEGIASDAQADARYHGGPHQALLLYSSDHYDFWAAELGLELGVGAFGENLTVSGATEEKVCLGDRLQLGTACLEVSMPRKPCYKLGVYNHSGRLPNAVKQHGRGGYYLRVIQPGEIEAGQSLLLAARPHPQWSVERVRAASRRPLEAALVEQILQLPQLGPRWAEDLRRKLEAEKAAVDA